MGLSCIVLEAADAIGGVWQYNGYPGARCDVESYDYSYRFSPELEQEWRWSERYATQPEILRYINHVADRFDLRRDIALKTRVVRAAYDAGSMRWKIAAEDGRHWTTTYFLLAVGQLSTPKDTVYPGQDSFTGQIIYSARWPKEPVDFSGKRVGIIGTGSSGVQMTPVIARQADHLTVFQRTPNFSIPAANSPVTEEEDRAVKADYRARREAARNSPSGLGFVPDSRAATDVPAEEREAAFEAAWDRLGFGFALTFRDIITDEASNAIASDFIRSKIAEQVDDPEVRDKLTPRGFPFATRRPSVDSGYFATFNRPNVALVDIAAQPISEITEKGIRTTDADYPLDMIIYATGFDAFTGSLLKPEIVGKGGVTLREAWAAGPQSFLGLCVHDFPNMFIIVGPGSPSLLSNVLLSSEEQIDWLALLIQHCRDRGIAEVEATKDAQDAWASTLNDQARKTLYPLAASFYMGAEMPGKPRVFMPYAGGVQRYRSILESVSENGYAGLMLREKDVVDA
ncbi:NAD(P)/FAD-dependent oxidoreductase [Sphingomonas sp. 1P06PA]|uniref:flavin-containing monooxygenase n=1 Tax=Sphingomonas sp. 1P06PA TaxID=554121 RepID=UPI0039A57EC3